MLKILVATDLSERSAYAVQRAVQLIRQQGGGEWALLHVIDADAPAELVARQVEHAQGLLQAQAQQLAEQAGSLPQVIVIRGEAEIVISEVAQGMRADLLIVGTHRASILRDLFKGTTVARVIRSSKVPVLRVAAPVTRAYDHSLMAMDQSAAALNALRTAERLGFLDQQRSDVLQVLEQLPASLRGAPGVGQQLIEAQRLETLQALRQTLHKEGMAIADERVHVIQGQITMAVVDRFNACSADLLVVGTHANSGIQRFLLGSVASTLLAELACDILVVPPQD